MENKNKIDRNKEDIIISSNHNNFINNNKEEEKDNYDNNNKDDKESIKTSSLTSTNNGTITSIITKARIMDKNAWKLYQKEIKNGLYNTKNYRI